MGLHPNFLQAAGMPAKITAAPLKLNQEVDSSSSPYIQGNFM
jgi:hypothetical protein